MQNYVMWILKAWLLILTLKIFIKILQMILKKWYDTSNYETDIPLPKGMNKKVKSLMKGELWGKNIKKKCCS